MLQLEDHPECSNLLWPRVSRPLLYIIYTIECGPRRSRALETLAILASTTTERPKLESWFKALGALDTYQNSGQSSGGSRCSRPEYSGPEDPALLGQSDSKARTHPLLVMQKNKPTSRVSASPQALMHPSTVPSHGKVVKRLSYPCLVSH